MNFNQINKILKTDKIILTPISSNDRMVINELFTDDEIRKYYIVPKEARQNYKMLTDYWLNDIKNEAGTCWIISKNGIGLFSKSQICGFIAFEFRDNLKNARISYAIDPKFRKQRIATLASKLVIQKLKEEKVISIEADIDKDNLNSESVVKRLGFETDKAKALIDPEMMRDGNPRFRYLWLKYLVETKTSIKEETLDLEATIAKIEPFLKEIIQEIETKGQQPKYLLRYFYLLGRIRFIEENYEEARGLFFECNISVGNEQFPDTHLYFYWLGRINEKESEFGSAKNCYTSALENFDNLNKDVTKNDIQIALTNLP